MLLGTTAHTSCTSQSPSTEERTYTPAMTRTFLLAVLTLVALTSCATSTPAPTTAEQSEPTQAGQVAPELDPEPTVRPRDIRAQSTCDDEWPLVLIPNAEGDGQHRFVAEVKVRNGGTAPARVRVVTIWYPVGVTDVTAEQTVRVPPGQRRTVKFTEPVTYAQLAGMAGRQHGDEMCRSRAHLLNP